MVHSSHIFWNQTIKGTCYQQFPVRILTGEIKFLELSTRRIFNVSEKMPCEHRLEQIFVRDKHDVYWKYTRDKGFRIVKLRFQQDFNDRLSLPQMASFNKKLRHKAKVTPHRTTLLRILDSQRENLRKMSDLRRDGKGSVLQGVFSGIAETVETMSDTGLNIVHAIAKGLKHLSNDSVEVVSEVGEDVVGFFKWTGGVSNFVLYVIDFLIISYLATRHIMEYRERRQPREGPRIVQVVGPPPIPPRGLTNSV